MKNFTSVVILFLITMSSLHAQLYTVPSCATSGSSTSYGPMYSTSTANATSRTAVVYSSGQLNGVAGKVINGMYFNRFTVDGSMTGIPNLKIYVKETTATDFGAGALDWATAITGATLVFDSSPLSIVGATAGWKLFPLSTNFTYSGTQNLAVFFEYQNTGASSNIAWSFESVSPCINTANSNTTKYSNTTNGTLATSLTSSDYRRPLIGFDFVESCPTPLSVSVTNVTSNSADISWVAPTVVPSNGYEYYLSTSNVAPEFVTPATGSIASGTSYLLSPLAQNTNYYLWIRSVCDAGDKGTWRAAVPFKTPCETVTDFFENFDTTPTGVGNLPNCWSRAGSSTNVYVNTGGALPGSAPNLLSFGFFSTNTVFAIMPPVSNLQANTHRLRFKAFCPIPGREILVGYFTNPADITTFVQLNTPGDFSLPYPTASEAVEFTLVPTNVPAGVTNLVFSLPQGTANAVNAFIDDVKWEFNSSCIEPYQLTATQITNTSAQLGWIAGDASAWEVQYGLQGFALGTGTVIGNITTNPYELSSLNPNTSYQYYVRGVCTGPINSSWAGPFAFKTQCNDVTEFSEDFEGYATGAAFPLPDCWIRAGAGSTIITTGSGGQMSPVNRLYMSGNGSGATPADAIAIMPPVSNLQANTHRLKFKAYATTANNTLEVGYVSDVSNLATYVLLQEITVPNSAATAYEIQVIPGALPAGVKNLVFKNSGLPTGAINIYIDDVIWEAIPTCIEPTGFLVSSITDISAQLAWTESATATAWEIEYGAPGFIPGTGAGTIVPAPTNPFVLTGLTPFTSYTYYVRSVCSSSDSSSWAGPLPFQTICSDVTEFSQNFEGYSTGASNPLADCWTRGGNGTTYIINGSVAPMSTVNKLYMQASGTSNPPTQGYAIMPPVSNLEANTHRLRFKSYATVADRTMNVGYLTNLNDVSTFVSLQEIVLPGSAATTAAEFIVTPGALPAGVKYLAFKNPGFTTGATTLYIDDVFWEAIPTCAIPTNLTLTGITNSTATLSWTEAATATAWEIEYGAPGFTPGTGTIVPAPTNPFTVTALNANTNYSFYVRAACSTTNFSPWSDVITAKTSCDEVTDYSQDFEGYAAGSTTPMPDCWGKLGGGATYITTGSVPPMSAVNRLNMYASGSTTTPTEGFGIVVLPAVSNLALETHELKFKAYASATNRTLQIGYLTNPLDALSFVVLSTEIMPGTSAASALTFTFVPSAIPAGVTHLALKNPGVSGAGTTIYIDDITWDVIGDLNTGSFDSASFRYYPNPVTDVLTVSYSSTISNVVVYNLLGQQVLSVQPNATQVTINLSELNSGTYIVKVTSDEVSKIIKVVKN